MIRKKIAKLYESAEKNLKVQYLHFIYESISKTPRDFLNANVY